MRSDQWLGAAVTSAGPGGKVNIFTTINIFTYVTPLHGSGDGVRAPVHAAGAGLPLGAGPVLHPHQQAAVRRDVGAVQGQGHLQVQHTALIPD